MYDWTGQRLLFTEMCILQRVGRCKWQHKRFRDLDNKGIFVRRLHLSSQKTTSSRHMLSTSAIRSLLMTKLHLKRLLLICTQQYSSANSYSLHTFAGSEGYKEYICKQVCSTQTFKAQEKFTHTFKLPGTLLRRLVSRLLLLHELTYEGPADLCRGSCRRVAAAEFLLQLIAQISPFSLASSVHSSWCVSCTYFNEKT